MDRDSRALASSVDNVDPIGEKAARIAPPFFGAQRGRPTDLDFGGIRCSTPHKIVEDPGIQPSATDKDLLEE